MENQEEKKETLDKFLNLVQSELEKRQDRPNQYVVAYKKVKDDSIVGYHGDSFCTPVQDILNAKRYSGENPYPQIEVISKNLRAILSINDSEAGEQLFSRFRRAIKKEHYSDVGPEDVYLEAVYLAEGTPKQVFKLNRID